MDPQQQSPTHRPRSPAIVRQGTNASVASVPQSVSSAHTAHLSVNAAQVPSDHTSDSGGSSDSTNHQSAQQSMKNNAPTRGRPHSLKSVCTRVSNLCQGNFGWLRTFQGDRERPKLILQKSLWRSLEHCSVHVPPVIIVSILLWLNIRKTYVGHQMFGPSNWKDETMFNILQGAAKIQEILMVASLTTVVFDLVRHNLLHTARGVPIGTVGAGITFSGGTYLLSKEFLGIFKVSGYSKVRKTIVGLTATLFCVIANSAGPASAILMIPQNQTWPSAQYDFFLNGTGLYDLWPSVLTERNIGGDQCKDLQRAIDEPSCAAGAYQAVGNYFNSFVSYPQGDSFVFNAADALTIRTLQGSIRSAATYGSETWKMAPHAATVSVQEPIRAVWSQRLKELSGNMRYPYLRTGRVDATVPVVRTACVPARNLSSVTNASGGGKFKMKFPVLLEYESWTQWPDKSSSFQNGQTQSFDLDESLLDIGAYSNSNRSLIIRTHRVPLPDQFGSVSTRLLILLSAADEEGHGTRFDLSIGCAIDARWAPGQNFLTSSQSDWALAGYSYPTQSSLFGQRVSATDGLSGQHFFLPDRHGGWRRIGLSPDWLQALTPTLPNRTTTSTLAAIFEDTIPALWAVIVYGPLPKAIYDYIAPNRYELLALAEHATASFVADGISRTGLHLQPRIWDLVNPLTKLAGSFSSGNPDIVLPAPYNSSATRVTPLQIKLTVESYAYKLGTGVNLFAVAVMCVYLAIVLAHVLVVVIWRRSVSSTWTTLTEILILALASNPLSGDEDRATREMLSCGAAGVERYKTHSQRVFVRVSADNEGRKEVELRLRANLDARVEEGEKYGIPNP